MQAVTAYWMRFTPRTRSILWNLLSGVLFSVMSTLVKYTGQQLPSIEVVFGRSIFGLLFIFPFILYFGPKQVFVTDRWKLQLVRCLIGTLAMTCTFYSLAKLPMVDVTAINFSKPIYILLIAAIFLRERVRPIQFILTIIGFIGILVILRPAPETFDANYLIAVFAAVLVAFAITIVKELTDSETPFSVLAWFSLLSTAISLPLAIYFWQEPTPRQWIELVSTGFVGIIAQFCVIRSYALAPASYLAPLGYINIFYTGFFGFMVFGHVPDAPSIIGAVIIMGSTFYLMRKGGKRREIVEDQTN
ncbi:MAG: DMT family transporter [Alphaproteobacteria bacterium]|nr:MAG: DMT family transporter [Alphaproteobacteria bacterium]